MGSRVVQSDNTYPWLAREIPLSFFTQRATLITSVNEILHKINLNYLENQSQLYLYGDDVINFVAKS